MSKYANVPVHEWLDPAAELLIIEQAAHEYRNLPVTNEDLAHIMWLRVYETYPWMIVDSQEDE